MPWYVEDSSLSSERETMQGMVKEAMSVDQVVFVLRFVLMLAVV